MMKYIKTLFATASLSLLMVACATQSPAPSPQALGPDFDLLSLDSSALAADNDSDMRAEKGHGFGPGKARMHQHMGRFLKSLNLSPEQKEQLKALRQEARSEFQNKSESRGQLKQIMKDAFLSSQFDPTAVKNQISPLIAAQKTNRSQKMAQKMVQVYAILTPEQRQQLVAQLNQMEEKMKTFEQLPFADKLLKFHAKGPGQRLEKMATELGLSEAQKTQFQVLVAASQPQRSAQFKQFSSVKQQLVTLFQSGTPSPEQVQKVLEQGMTDLEGQMEQRLQMVAKVHQILTAEQRSALVEKLESRGKQMRERIQRRSHHADPFS